MHLMSVKRQLGDRGCAINYRHIIGHLVRKPGAFAEYRFRDALFPSVVFRKGYDWLRSRHENRKADKEYLAILHLAAKESESGVEKALQDLLFERNFLIQVLH